MTETNAELKDFSVPIGPKTKAPGKAAYDRHAQNGERSKIERVLWCAMGKADFDGLVNDVDRIHDAFIGGMRCQAGMSEDEARIIVPAVLKGISATVRRTDWRKGYGRVDPSATVPEVAAHLIIGAVDLVLEALSSSKMGAYRNRNQEFLEVMAEFAEEANGSLSANMSFYERLGKQVAEAVLDHKLIGAAPQLTPSGTHQYDSIEQAALEQLVYFIQAGDSGPIKIGIARDPKARLNNLQTAHHEDLSIRAITAGGAEQEKAYHSQFSEHSLRGEWFSPASPILAEIARLKGDM